MTGNAERHTETAGIIEECSRRGGADGQPVVLPAEHKADGIWRIVAMTQMSPIEPFQAGDDAVGDYRQEARSFLVKSRRYLAEGDLHQASEKGWAAAAWMAKSVADARGWEYTRHSQFSVVLNNARKATGDARLAGMRSIANELHGNFYTRKRFLDADAIGEDLEQIAILLDILEPLTQTDQGA